MMWILAGLYCGGLWLIFAKLKLMKFSLPVALLAGSVGPGLIVVFLFCAQYYHPYTPDGRVFFETVPIVPQLRQAGRVAEVVVVPNQPIAAGDVLFRIDPIPYQNTVDRLVATLDQAQQNEQVAQASVTVAEATEKRTTANLEFATRERDRLSELFKQNSTSQSEYDSAIIRFYEAEASLIQANAAVIQAKLAIDVANSEIKQTETQLFDARYDLEQTTVTAPGNGYVTNLQLRNGMLVGGAGATSVMSFILYSSDQNRGVVVAAFNQKNYLRIKPGQYAEVALYNYPGQIFTARVQNVIDVSGAGQLDASGRLPDNLGPKTVTTFAVRIKLDDAENLRLPGGSQAQVAIYTEDLQVTGLPIMFLIRANSWLRYVL